MAIERIYLVGMPGVGKSSLGKKLAQKLQWLWLDLDQLITEKAGQSIASLFNAHGETFFRDLEQSVLKESFAQTACVISCGGGTSSYSNNMELINKNGLSIYLSASDEFIKQRILQAKEPRPLFKGLNEKELLQKIKDLQALRSPFYRQAQMEFEIPIKDVNALYSKALELIKQG